MILTDDTVFVAGAPLTFPLGDLAGTYADRRGAVMRAISAADGSTRAEHKLNRFPVWDGMAAAYGSLFIVYQDGSVERWGE